jgi:molybdenum cofactor cytidylyltransferase
LKNPPKKAQENTAVIILAGGSSSRLGKPKQLIHYQNNSLIKHAIKTALQIAFNPVIVVTGFLHHELVGETESLPVQLVHNEQWQEGIGSSIRTGINFLQQSNQSNQVDAALILLCDQPLVSAQHLNLLTTKFYSDKNSMVAATGYAEIGGVPAVFDKSLFSVLQDLPGSRGAQWLFEKYSNQLAFVPFEGASIDIDTEDDYLRLLKLTENQPD